MQNLLVAATLEDLALLLESIMNVYGPDARWSPGEDTICITTAQGIEIYITPGENSYVQDPR